VQLGLQAWRALTSAKSVRLTPSQEKNRWLLGQLSAVPAKAFSYKVVDEKQTRRDLLHHFSQQNPSPALISRKALNCALLSPTGYQSLAKHKDKVWFFQKWQSVSHTLDSVTFESMHRNNFLQDCDLLFTEMPMVGGGQRRFTSPREAKGYSPKSNTPPSASSTPPQNVQPPAFAPQPTKKTLAPDMSDHPLIRLLEDQPAQTKRNKEPISPSTSSSSAKASTKENNASGSRNAESIIEELPPNESEEMEEDIHEKLPSDEIGGKDSDPQKEAVSSEPKKDSPFTTTKSCDVTQTEGDVGKRPNEGDSSLKTIASYERAETSKSELTSPSNVDLSRREYRDVGPASKSVLATPSTSKTEFSSAASCDKISVQCKSSKLTTISSAGPGPDFNIATQEHQATTPPKSQITLEVAGSDSSDDDEEEDAVESKATIEKQLLFSSLSVAITPSERSLATVKVKEDIRRRGLVPMEEAMRELCPMKKNACRRKKKLRVPRSQRTLKKKEPPKNFVYENLKFNNKK